VRRIFGPRRLGTRARLDFSAPGLAGVAAARAAVAKLRPVVHQDPLELAAQRHGSLQVCEYRSQVRHGQFSLSCRLGGAGSIELRRVSLRESHPANQCPSVLHSARPVRQSPASIVALVQQDDHPFLPRHHSTRWLGLLADCRVRERCGAPIRPNRASGPTARGFQHQACGRLPTLTLATRI